MDDINDSAKAEKDLQGLIDWLENEQTRELVDMINKAAQGQPVEEAANRYKARYRHGGSMEKLSDLFENLEDRSESCLEISLRGLMNELDCCLAGLLNAEAGFSLLLHENHGLESAELGSLQKLTNRLREVQQAANSFRERIIHVGASIATVPAEEPRPLRRVNI